MISASAVKSKETGPHLNDLDRGPYKPYPLDYTLLDDTITRSWVSPNHALLSMAR